MRYSSYVVLALVLATSSRAHADRKAFGYTYEYATLPEGVTELELWHTQLRGTWDSSSPQFVEEKIEIEHGITDHYTASFYTVLTQVASSDPTEAQPLSLEAVRIENRYRFAERGEWPVDTVAYLEVAKDFGRSIYELEGKVILAHDFDRLTVAGNAIVELYVGNDAEGGAHAEYGWAAGASYEITPKVRLGAETWGEYAEQKVRSAAGPAIGLAAGKLWVEGTAGLGISNYDDEAIGAFSARLLMGVTF
jgi:hypothetical protein